MKWNLCEKCRISKPLQQKKSQFYDSLNFPLCKMQKGVMWKNTKMSCRISKSNNSIFKLSSLIKIKKKENWHKMKCKPIIITIYSFCKHINIWFTKQKAKKKLCSKKRNKYKLRNNWTIKNNARFHKNLFQKRIHKQFSVILISFNFVSFYTVFFFAEL